MVNINRASMSTKDIGALFVLKTIYIFLSFYIFYNIKYF